MDPKKETVTIEELTVSNMYEIQAVINILQKKGILTKEEILEEIKELTKERNNKIN